MTRCDAAVVGSGISGLAAACLLAENGRKVVLLEQHKIPGGLLQRFTRRGVAFDSGFHYVGGTGPGGPFRRYLARLGVLDRVRLEPFDPEGFDEIVLPGRRFRFPVGEDRVVEALSAAFPTESAVIARFFARLEEETRRHPFFSFEEEVLGVASHHMAPPETVSAALADVRSIDLRAILSAHSMLYGVPADRAALEAHALVSRSFFHSTHGLAGGGDALTEALVRRFEELGGEVRLSADVVRIATAAGRVTGVDTVRSGSLETNTVIAAVHPSIVLGLVGDEAVTPRVARRIRGLRNAPSALSANFVVRGADHAFRRNWFWFPRPEDSWQERRPWFEKDVDPPGMAILMGPRAEGTPDSTVLQVVCLMREDEADGTGSRADWRRRKMEAARRLVPAIEQCVPEWRGRIELIDASTPYAMRHFVRSPEGSCYGVECSTEQWTARWRLQSFGIDGLRLAGQSVGLPGMLGSIVTAFVAVASLDGSTQRLYSELRQVPVGC